MEQFLQGRGKGGVGNLVYIYSPVWFWGDYWNQHLHMRSVGEKTICLGWCCVWWQPSWWMLWASFGLAAWDSWDRQARTQHRGSKLVLSRDECHVPSGPGRGSGNLSFLMDGWRCRCLWNAISRLWFGAVPQAWHRPARARSRLRGTASALCRWAGRQCSHQVFDTTFRVWFLSCFPLRRSVGSCISDLQRCGFVEEELQPCSWPQAVKPQGFLLMLRSLLLMQKSRERI